MRCCFFFPITIIPVQINKNIEESDNISEVILESLNLNNLQIYDNDVIVIAQKIISKSENRILNLRNMLFHHQNQLNYFHHEKDPRLIELILSESLELYA